MKKHCILLIAATFAAAAFSQTPPDLSEAGFAVCEWEDCCDGDEVLLGAFAPKQERFFFMSRTVTSKKKLVAVRSTQIEDAVPDALFWKFSVDANGMRLLSPDGTNGLQGGGKGNTDLQLSADGLKFYWTPRMADGLLTLQGKGEDRFVGLSAYGDKDSYFGYFTQSGADDVHLYIYSRKNFTPVPPEQSLVDGVLRLTGNWSAEALADLQLEGVGAVDLTSIRIPRDAVSFTHYPEEGNIPIFVSQSAKARVPDTWRFVVCGDELLTDVTLSDARSLLLPREFHAESGKMHYARTMCTDEGWETLVLPFGAEVPQGVEAFRLESAGDDGLHFRSVRKVECGIPIIVRKDGHSSQSNNTVWSCNEGVVKTSEAVEGIFHGTYNGRVLSSEDVDVFMMGEDGKAFVKALAGSTLPPFRACLEMKAKQSRLPINVATSLADISCKHGVRKETFDLAGRHVCKPVRGIHVREGEKILFVPER